MNNLMIDIETYGTSSNSVILSIAAIEFDIDTGKTGKTFYVNIDPASCVNAGLKQDSQTVQWWKEQDKKAWQRLTKGRVSLKVAMTRFNEFLSEKTYIPWGNSARFDLGLITDAMAAVGMKPNWSFRNERCVRTLVGFAPEVKEKHVFQGVMHDALDDCRNQISYCSKIWNKLKGKNTVKMAAESVNTEKKDLHLYHLKCISVNPEKSHPNKYLKQDRERFTKMFNDSKKDNAYLVFANYSDKSNQIKLIYIQTLTDNGFHTLKEKVIPYNEYKKWVNTRSSKYNIILKNKMNKTWA